MPAKSINMHGKIYNLYDEIERTKIQAQKFAQEIREQGKVAFLNPLKRKNKETVYMIYVAEKSVRNISTRKYVSIKEILEEYSKGQESYSKWMDILRETQIIENATKNAYIKEILDKEIPKELVSKKSNKKIPKKLISKKSNNKKK